MPYGAREPTVQEEGVDGDEGARSKDAVVELYERRVLKHVAPQEVCLLRVYRLARVEGREELGLGWCEAKAHVRELVVDEAGVEAGDKSARECGNRDETGREGCAEAEGPERARA